MHRSKYQCQHCSRELPTIDSREGISELKAVKKPSTAAQSIVAETIQETNGRGITAGITHRATGNASTKKSSRPK